MKYGNVGIAFEPYFSGGCHTGSLTNADVFGNQMTGSHVFKFQTAVWLGFGGSTPRVYKNKVVWNKLYDNEVGIRFAADAVDNDAQRNGFGRTITPIIDEGTGNLY